MKIYKNSFTIGIDEAGRGPLAGPVAVGTVMCSQDFDMKLLKGIKDSKVLSESEREAWFAKLLQWQKEKMLCYSVTLVSAKIIDDNGLTYAVQYGIGKCLKKIEADCSISAVLLDGLLKAPKEFTNQKTIIRGDATEPLISLAAIAAKVTRDRKMKKLALIYPLYNFEQHKGYGTSFHREKIKLHGPCAIHRQRFLKNILSNEVVNEI